MVHRHELAEREPIEQRTLLHVLRRNLRERPDQPAVVGPDGSITYAELWDDARVGAGALRAAGVQADDTVLLMLDNHLDFVRTWLGVVMSGGVEVPVNTAYRGGILAHVANDCAARIAVIDVDYLERLAAVREELTTLHTVYVRGLAGPPPAVDGWQILPFDALREAAPAEPVEVFPWTRLGLMYTSGTTGNSKGVIAGHGLAYSYSSPMWIEPGERIMVNLPLFHIGGQWAGVFAAWQNGGTAVVIPRFSASTFFDDVRRFDCAQTLMLGAMASFLWALPPRADDRDHPMRVANMVPVLANSAAFGERFGISVGSAYGLTEFSSPLLVPYGEAEPGLAGRLRPDYEARVVDENDVEVPTGVTGELVLRAKVPWANMLGYHGLPDATTHAWRNLWFHTGDAMRKDDDGRFHFIDRVNDALRVRGENVSSFEVETEVLRFEGVAECAVVAVPSEHTEDDILAVIVTSDDLTVDPAELIEFLVERLPYFMVPRYVQVVSQLPITPTQKVKKAELRSAGVTAGTWDAHAHGLRVTRDGLQRATAAT